MKKEKILIDEEGKKDMTQKLNLKKKNQLHGQADLAIQ